MAGERKQAEAIKARLDPALGQWSVFDYDELADLEDLPQIYVEMAVAQRGGSPVRMCGGRPMLGWRLTTRVVAGTVDEARWAREKVAAALLDQRLTVDGLESTPVRFETEDVIGPDDGRYSGLTTWTYAL